MTTCECNLTGSLYGRGSYFTSNFDEAADEEYAVPDKDARQHQYVIQARVLTGKVALGKVGMKEPPPLQEESLVRFDAVVNNVAEPRIFVIFQDSKAYPDYIIVYHDDGL